MAYLVAATTVAACSVAAVGAASSAAVVVVAPSAAVADVAPSDAHPAAPLDYAVALGASFQVAAEIHKVPMAATAAMTVKPPSLLRRARI